MCGNHSVALCAGLPQGSGVGASAAAKSLEEATLPQSREGSPTDFEDAGGGYSTFIHRIQQVIDKKQEVKGQ